jgi:hypothetical protein
MMVLGTGLRWRTGLVAAGLLAGVTAQAQVASAADEIAMPPYAEETYMEPPPAVVYREETYAVPVRRPPPPVEVAVLPPREVFAVVRERGYEPIGAIRRRGWVYSVSVLGPDGEDGRIVVDARSGRVLRFVPAYAMSPRLSHEIGARYGRFGQPIAEPRYAPRPPVGVPYSAVHRAAPHVASRTPAAVPVPRPRHAGKAKPAVAKATDRPAVDTAKTATATENIAVTKPAATAAQAAASAEPATVGAVQASVKPSEAKPAAARPAEVELKPTQDMPPVQPLD